jgi:tetratricopeptide (TPR) repeat protein
LAPQLFIVTEAFAIRKSPEYDKKMISYSKGLLWAFICLLGACSSQKPTSRDPKTVPNFELGFSAYKEKNYPSAVEQFEKVLVQNSSDSEARMMLGLSYLGLLKPARAEQEVKTACQSHSQWPLCWNNLAFVYIKNKKYTESIEAADRALAVPSFSTPHLALINKAHALTELNKYTEALKILEEAKILNADYCPTRIHLTRNYLKLNRPEEALLEIRFALGKCPQEALVHLWEAYALFLAKDEAKSFTKLRFIRQRFPKGLAMEEATRWMGLLRESIPLPEPPLESN